jgi:hypothetical protein
VAAEALCADGDVAHSFAALKFVSRSMVRCLLRLVLLRLAWATAAGKARCRISTAVLIAGRGYAARNSWIRLLMSEVLGRQEVPGASISSGCDPGPQWPGTRFTCSWVIPRRPSGHLYRRIAAQRVRAAAVMRMYQRGRLAPLPGIRVNGARWRSRLAASRSHAGNDVRKVGGSGLEVAADPRIRVMRGRFGGGEDK